MRPAPSASRVEPSPDSPSPTLLVVCAHGTADPRGRAAVGGLVAAVRRLTAHAARAGPWGTSAEVSVRAAYVDVQPPTPDRVLAVIADGIVLHPVVPPPVVLVPLLLVRGYHTRVDLGGVAASRPGVLVASPLGAGAEVVEVLAARCRAAAGAPRPGDQVILAAAGSSDPRVPAEIDRVAEAFSRRTGWPTRPAYLRAAEPLLPDAVAAARAHAGVGRVIVATHLLAPGVLADKVAACGADVVTAPLLASRPDGATRLLAAAVLARCRAVQVNNGVR
ncbi:MAG: CbiX/SirB N-terminal domain-containing protein [Dermatophilaceae bacterium]